MVLGRIALAIITGCYLSIVVIIYNNKVMRSLRTRKSLLDGLSPWEAKHSEEEEN